MNKRKAKYEMKTQNKLRVEEGPQKVIEVQNARKLQSHKILKQFRLMS